MLTRIGSSFFQPPIKLFLLTRGSDHRPVLPSLLSSTETYKGSFRFDKYFLDKPNVKENVIEAWNKNLPVSGRLKSCRKALSHWKKQNNLNSMERIHHLQSRLEEEQSASMPSLQMMTILKQDLIKAYKEEEKYWNKKSSDQWLDEGDQHTKFFHDSVKATRNKNRLDKLFVNGNLQRSEASEGEVSVGYFTHLYKSSNPDSFQQLFHRFRPKVTNAMNESLTQPVSKEEIKEAVFSIKPSSAPGSDGMTGLFYQKYWDVVGSQVTLEVQNIFETGIFPTGWNYTQLCLLPKIVKLTRMADLRPINLCSVMYKILSKVLVRRLQPLLPAIASPTQSVFFFF